MPFKDLTPNKVEEKGKEEILAKPSIWIEILNINSHWAELYIDAFIQDKTIETLLKDTDCFNAWIKYMGDFHAPYPADEQKACTLMLPRTKKVDVAHINYAGGGYIYYSYHYSTPAPAGKTSSTGATDMHLFDEDRKFVTLQGYRCNTSNHKIKTAYQYEQERGKSFATKILQALNTSTVLTLDHAFKRKQSDLTGSGAPREALPGLLNMKYYPLMVALFKKLSPKVAMTELFISSEIMGAKSLLDQLIDTLPDKETRNALSQMINHVLAVEEKTQLSWWYKKIPTSVLAKFETKSPSLAARLRDAAAPIKAATLVVRTTETTIPPGAIELKSTKKELPEAEDNDATPIAAPVTFGDGMTLNEVLLQASNGKTVIYPEVLTELNQHPQILRDIYTRNMQVAIFYSIQMQDSAMQTFVQSKSLSDAVMSSIIFALLRSNNTSAFGIKCFGYALAETKEAVFLKIMANREHEQTPDNVISTIMSIVTADNAVRLIPAILLQTSLFLGSTHITAPVRALIMAQADAALVNRLGLALTSYISAISDNETRQATLIYVFKWITPKTWEEFCDTGSTAQILPLLDAVTPENAAELLVPAPTLLDRFIVHHRYTEALALFLKAPKHFGGTSGDALPGSIKKLIAQTNENLRTNPNARSDAEFKEAGISPEFMKFLITISDEHQKADAYIEMVKKHRVIARQFTALYTEEQLNALVASATTLNVDHFFERLINAFKTDMPLALLNKASVSSPLDFTQYHHQNTPIPYIVAEMMDYEKQPGTHALLMQAIIKRLSAGDLLALIVNVFKTARPLDTQLGRFGRMEFAEAAHACEDKTVLPIFAMLVLPHLFGHPNWYTKEIDFLLTQLNALPNRDAWVAAFMRKHTHTCVYPLMYDAPAVAKQFYALSPQAFGPPNFEQEPNALAFATNMQVLVGKAPSSAVGQRNMLRMSQENDVDDADAKKNLMPEFK